MVLGEILSAISAFFEQLLRRLFSIMSGDGAGAITGDPRNTLRVFIKYAGGKTISCDLNPTWSIKRVKEEIAPKLGVDASEIKIIFAGNELPDSFVLETSDVGQQSYLHAVRVRLDLNPSPGGGSLTLEENGGPDHLAALQSSTRTFTPSEGGGGALSPTPEQNSAILNDDPSISSVPSTKSDFFVYCSTCEDLQEGKLRVRCATCLSGAFTVSRHPQNWNDVLTPKVIPGNCEVCGGQDGGQGDISTFASFYFKCSSHVTSGEDDSSPPLQLVKRNHLDTVPCIACGDAKEICVVFNCVGGEGAGHACCVECFKAYILFKIGQRDFVQDNRVGYTVGCPALCQDSLVEDPHHFKLMGRHEYERYQRFATEECLLQLGGIFCPQPDCGMGIIPEDSGNCNKIACLHGCGYVFCKLCLEGWHIGACDSTSRPDNSQEGPSSTCPTAFNVTPDRAAQSQWNETQRALRLNTKPCPNCRVPTERAGGCMHMECTKCKFQWCWVCQTKWNRECMGNHWFG